jgi:hypothetical protein
MASYTLFKEQIDAEGAFRCQKCGNIRPLSMHRQMDGLDVCTYTCWKRFGKLDAEASFQEALALAASIPEEPVEFPIERALADYPEEA